ncbi:MAG: response regulator [Jaaginema sp. PMC 1079.18]|nr:response regulator [Jaaginema sp. PMC 1080.18]MEC4851092.1 response regulator [Jaaginema sp. PMC 1079.18]MEC4867040.1 response regulator [Jaaginema sp. PMC 1078.18]
MEAEQLKKITGYFIEEAKEHLETIEQGVTELQATIDDPEQVTEVYRAAHSIKGGAAMLELECIRKTAHRLEDYFKQLKEHSVTVDETLSNWLTPIYRGLQTLVADLEKNYAVAPEIETQVMTAIEPLFDQTETYLNHLMNPVLGESQTEVQELPDSAEFLENLITSDFSIDSGRDRAMASESFSDSSSDLGSDELSTLANLFEADGTDINQTLADTDSDLQLLAELTGGDFGWDDDNNDREEVDDLLDQLTHSGAGENEQNHADFSDDLAFLDDFALETDESTVLKGQPELSNSLDSLEALFTENPAVADTETNGKSNSTSSLPKKAHPENHQGIGKDTNHDLDSLFADFNNNDKGELFNTQASQSEFEEFDLGLGEELDEDVNFADLDDLLATSELESNDSTPPLSETLEANSTTQLDDLLATGNASAIPSELDEGENTLDAGLDDLLEIGNVGETVSETASEVSLDELLDFGATDVEPAKAHNGNTSAPVDKAEQADHLPATQFPESSTTPQKGDRLQYYDRIEELEHLLTLSPPLDNHQIFASLEQLLDQDPTLETPLSVDLSDTSDVTLAPDDEFGDLEDLIQDIEAKVGGPPTTKGSRTSRNQRNNRGSFNKTKVEQTLKVPVKQMDNLSNLVGELVVNRNSLEGDEDKLRQSLDTLMHQVQSLSDVGGRMQDLYERSLLEDALLKSRQAYRAKYGANNPVAEEEEEGLDVLEMDSFTKFHELAQEVIEMIVRVRESASDIALWVDDIDLVARTLRQVTSQLQEGLTKARMVPFARTADRLPLAVRKICPQLGKEAQLHVEGRETLIDKMILEHLSDPLTHLVNNALTHGIESPEERLAHNKPTAGQITVRALQQGNQTAIVVSDDGAGIDPRRIKQKAIEKGVISPAQAQKLSDLETYDLLFKAGFSTKDQADNFSGRGVGLDVVRNDIMEIRGSVSIDSKQGKGTTFTIRLPLTLSICKALCCISENAPMAFPMDGVEDMVDIPVERIYKGEDGHEYVRWRDAQLHYCPLSDLLTYNRKLGRGNIYAGNRDDNAVSVVILRSATSFLAIGVDRVIGEQEIVIKQINGPVPKSAGIAGATVQGDGRIMAIADVMELIQIAEGRLRKDTTSLWRETNVEIIEDTDTGSTEPTVLIVDDSVTVRSLLSMTFEKAGYQVEQARDGQDAWDKLTGGLPCDLVFCDIEMPRVDGLELLGRIQKEASLAHIPIAMLTSRGAERHRRVAAELGACAYFTKPYVEQDLLEATRSMMKGEVLLEGSTRVAQPRPHRKAESQAPTTLLPSLMTVEPTQPKVMIVDDSVTVRSLLSMTFENAGYEVLQARDGQDAWEQLQGGQQCDLAFLDIEMPKMDGLELLGRIQSDEHLKHIPVAMLTSRGAQKMQQRAAERGASAYFTKPYVEQELLDAAEALRSGQVLLKNSTRQTQTVPPPESLPEPEPPTPPQKDFPDRPRVLIVDDSVTVRSLLSMTFENAGYEVAQARDGKHALQQLQGGLEVDVAFLDIEMPRMDGLTLLATLQEDEKLKHLPVAMLTSRGAERMKRRAAETGAKGYFVKPYVEEVLLDGAKQLILGETGVGNWFDRSLPIPSED